MNTPGKNNTPGPISLTHLSRSLNMSRQKNIYSLQPPSTQDEPSLQNSKQLTLEEYGYILNRYCQGYTANEIAPQINRHPGSVSHLTTRVARQILNRKQVRTQSSIIERIIWAYVDRIQKKFDSRIKIESLHKPVGFTKSWQLTVEANDTKHTVIANDLLSGLAELDKFECAS